MFDYDDRVMLESLLKGSGQAQIKWVMFNPDSVQQTADSSRYIAIHQAEPNYWVKERTIICRHGSSRPMTTSGGATYQVPEGTDWLVEVTSHTTLKGALINRHYLVYVWEDTSMSPQEIWEEVAVAFSKASVRFGWDPRECVPV